MELIIEKGIDIKQVFSQVTNLDWNSKLVRKYALEIDHEYSEFIRISNNDNSSIAQYKECFYKAKNIMISCQDKNLAKIINLIFNQAGKELISEIINETPIENHKDLVNWFNIFGVKFSFYNADHILLTSQSSSNESQHYIKDDQGNYINFKELCKVQIIDGKLYNTFTGNIIDSGHNSCLYVIDKKGQLFVNINQITMNHSFMLSGYNQKHNLDGISMFGYGKPVSCGGYITIKNGIITHIDNGSGHYQPDHNMLLHACSKLFNSGVMDPNIKLFDHLKNLIFVDNLSDFDIEEVIATGEYPYLDY